MFQVELAETGQKASLYEDLVHAVVSAGEVQVTFGKWSGWIEGISLNGYEMIEYGYALRPNFWRAPTDNDFGANLHRRFVDWKNPGLKLKSFKAEEQGNRVQVVTTYELPRLAAVLTMTYLIGGNGEIRISEQLAVDKEKKDMPHLFRFGMQLVMPGRFDRIDYYGRGPVENYDDRNESQRLGRYRQLVKDQYYPYIRPQESGTKSDIRWWKLTDIDGRGLAIRSDVPFSASALNYLPEDLDDGWDKDQRHSGELKPRGLTTLSFDLKQMGLGCINSWGAWPLQPYLLPYQDDEMNGEIEEGKTRAPMVRYQEGKSINMIWANESIGIDPNTGEEVFIALNGDKVNKWSTDNYKPLGCSDPKFEGNFGTMFMYKGFQLNAYFRYSYGADVYNQTLVDKVENVDPKENADRRVLYDRWKTPGDVAKFKAISNTEATMPTSRFIEQENYITLSSLNLSYQFDAGRLRHYGIERLKLSLIGNDVFRASTVKMERGTSYPFARNYSVALQVTF